MQCRVAGWLVAVGLALGACSSENVRPPPMMMGTAGMVAVGTPNDQPCSHDVDQDGYCSPFYLERSTKIDCDDFDAQRFPGAPERLNALDDDCDGSADEELARACLFTAELPENGCELATQLVAGSEHACVLTSGQRVRCWGWSNKGQLGLPGLRTSPVPVAVPGVEGATAVVAGADQTCALVGAEAICWGGGMGFPFHVPLPPNTKKIAVSGRIYALDEEGQLWHRPFLAGKADASIFAPLAEGIADLASGPVTCALTSMGALNCWNAMAEAVNIPGAAIDLVQGQGNGSVCYRQAGELKCLAAGSMSAETIAGNGSAVGWAVSNTFGCAMNAAGKVACWTAQGPKTIDDAVQLAAGAYFGCVLRQYGHLSCFGRNDGGWLGNGKSLPGDVPEPVDVAAGWDEPVRPTLLLGAQPLGACDVAADLAALAVAGDLHAALATCREECANRLDVDACLNACVKPPATLSAACFGCFAALGACSGEGCYDTFQTCAGFPVDAWVLPARAPSFGCVGASCQLGKEVGQHCEPFECACNEDTKVCMAPGGCGGDGYLSDGSCRRACGYCSPTETCVMARGSGATFQPAYCDSP